jgi:hypothetical protein
VRSTLMDDQSILNRVDTLIDEDLSGPLHGVRR